MDRRQFLVLCALAIATGPSPAAAGDQAELDWASFDQLASVFLSLVHATDPIADFIEKRRFIGFLDDVNETLGDIIADKRDIYFRLDSAACSDEENTPIEAVESSRDLSRLLQVLESEIKTLGVCVRISEIREDAFDLSDQMSSIRGGKAWISRVDDYCRMSAGDDRKGFLQEIKTSTQMVSAAQKQLGELLTKLGQ